MRSPEVATDYKFFGVLDRAADQDQLVRSDGAFATLEFGWLVQRLIRHGITVKIVHEEPDRLEFSIIPENEVQEYYLLRMIDHTGKKR